MLSNKQRRRRETAVRRAAESLERRTLLSANYNSVNIDTNGVVWVYGTSGADTIVVSLAIGSGSTLDVSLNGATSSYAVSKVHEVVAYGLQGADTMEVNQTNGDVTTLVQFHGGKGADTLVGGSGADSLYGGRGNDQIHAGSGTDLLQGGLGANGLLAGAGADTIYSGSTNDTVAGTTAADQVNLSGPTSVDQPARATPLGIVRDPNTSGITQNNSTYIQIASGYSPDQIRAAYGLPSLADTSNTNLGQGQTIGIVDAFGNPHALEDLTVFSQQFGLPLPNSSNFEVIAQGGTPALDTGWAGETDLDIEWAHAIAPDAKIVLVEAQSDLISSDLLDAVEVAAQQVSNAGGGVVSMSFGGPENDVAVQEFIPQWDAVFSAYHNISFIASAGDDGPEVEYPASSPYVTAVGGTTLPLDISGNRDGEETGWSGSGGGVSGYYGETPSYQQGLTYYTSTTNPDGTINLVPTQIQSRAVPDVAWEADPSTGVALYDTIAEYGVTGWTPGGIGGTSVGSPSFAAFVTLANQLRQQAGLADLGDDLSQQLYSADANDPTDNFNDIVAGDSSGVGGTNYTGPGYDTVTGLGTPKGQLIQTLSTSNVPYVSTSFTWSAKYYAPSSGGSSVSTIDWVDVKGTGQANGGSSLDLSFVQDTTPVFQPSGDTSDGVPITFYGDPGFAGQPVNSTGSDISLYTSASTIDSAGDYRVYGYGYFSSPDIVPATGTAPNLEFNGTMYLGGDGHYHIQLSFYTVGQPQNPGGFLAHDAPILSGSLQG